MKKWTLKPKGGHWLKAKDVKQKWRVLNMNKAFIMQTRVKKMAERYQEEHPELSEKEVMEAVVLKVVGPEGVEKFNELIDKPDECKKIMKGHIKKKKKKKKVKESENNQEKNEKEETDLEGLLEDIPEAD